MSTDKNSVRPTRTPLDRCKNFIGKNPSMQNSKANSLRQDQYPLRPGQSSLITSGGSAAQATLNECLHLAPSVRETRFPWHYASWIEARTSAAPARNTLEAAECLPLDSAGCLPLEAAAGYGQEEICRLLLSRGADPNQDAHLPLAAAARGRTRGDLPPAA